MMKRNMEQIFSIYTALRFIKAFSLLLIVSFFVPAFAQNTITLQIEEEGDGYRLRWEAPDYQSRWAVLRASDAFMSSPDTLAITSDTTWLDTRDYEIISDNVFYKVIPVLVGDNPNEAVIIENFDAMFTLQSYAGEDVEPDGYEFVEGEAGNPDYLSLTGNTWKIQEIEARTLEMNTLWAIDLKRETLGRMQMIGISDGVDEMFYVIWGQAAPNTDPWITTYEGWFPANQWVTVYLPVGEDWHGRFGDFTDIDQVIYVNENDGVWPRGVLDIDNLRDVTDSYLLAPEADFSWEIQSLSENELTVSFNNLSYDQDSDELDYYWNFGDNSISTDEHPVHVYPRGGNWTASLRVTDSEENWNVYTSTVVDSPRVVPGPFTISCSGDVVFARSLQNVINDNGVDYLFENIVDYIEPADLSICNLENPLTNSTNHHPTKTIYFKGTPENVVGISNTGYDWVSLANNHIIDYMEEGLIETQQALDGVNVLYGGAGMNDIEAKRITNLSYNGTSIGIIGMSNRTGHYNNYQPFLDAGRNRPGFALWNRTSIETEIPKATETSDLVMLQVHCGSEYSRYPRDGDNLPEFLEEVPPDDEYVTFELHPDSGEVALRHYAVDMGADLVVCHHPHIIHGVEIYNGKLIAHSLGNFIFDLDMNETHPSMLLEILVEDGDVNDAIVRPVWIEDYRPGVASGGLAKSILDYLTHYSRLLNTHLVRYPGEEVAHVLWDTTGARFNEDVIDTLELVNIGGGWKTSRPFKMEGEGYITEIEILNSDAPGMVRYGRDILLYGNMEDEGAQPWNLNSSYEGYDDDYSCEGERSVFLAVPSNAGDNYVTLLERNVRIYPEYDHSVLGWQRTENATRSEFQVRFYNARSNGSMQNETIPLSLYGDNTWTPAWADFENMGGSWTYLNIRLSTYPSGEGVSRSWFDDLNFIQWEDWQNSSQSSVYLPYPNGYRFAQVRVEDMMANQVIVRYKRELPFDAPAWDGIAESAQSNID